MPTENRTSIADIWSTVRSVLRNRNSEGRKELVKNFLVILAICVLACISILSFYTHTILKVDSQNKMDTYEMSLSSLEKTVSSVFQSSLETFMYKIMDSTAVLSFSFSGSSRPVLSTVISRVRSDLISAVSGIHPFREAFLYVPLADMCVSSKGTYGSLSTLPQYYRGILAEYIYGDKDLMHSFTLEGEEYVLFLSSSGYVIAKELFVSGGKGQAIAFLPIDTQGIYTTISGIYGIEDNGNISVYLYDGDGKGVWRDFLEYSDESTSGSSTFIHRPFELLSWEYVMELSSSALVASPSMWIDRFLLLVVIMVIFFLSFTVFSVSFFQKPLSRISRMLSMSVSGMETDEEKRDGVSTDIESISNAISLLSKRHRELDSAIKAASEDILGNVFAQLLDGKAIDLSSVENVLSSTGSSFTGSGLYSVLLVTIPLSSDGENVRHTVSAFLDEGSGTRDITHFELGGNGECISVLQFNGEKISISDARRILSALPDSLRETLGREGFTCGVSFGNLYHSVMDICFSYRECRERIEKGGDSQCGTDTFTERVRQIVEWTEKGEDKAASGLVEMVIDRICEDGETMEERGLKLLEELRARMSAVDYVDMAGAEGVIESYEKASGSATRERLEKSVSQMLELFGKEIGKQRNPYLVKARAYIAEHYSDYDLSLEKVSGVLGISSSYLSRIFSSNLNIRYIDYVNRYKISVSMDKLLSSDMSISEIAAECGMISSRNYILAFKKFYGTTPGEYRKKARKDVPL